MRTAVEKNRRYLHVVVRYERDFFALRITIEFGVKCRRRRFSDFYRTELPAVTASQRRPEEIVEGKCVKSVIRHACYGKSFL